MEGGRGNELEYREEKGETTNFIWHSKPSGGELCTLYSSGSVPPPGGGGGEGHQREREKEIH